MWPLSWTWHSSSPGVVHRWQDAATGGVAQRVGRQFAGGDDQVASAEGGKPGLSCVSPNECADPGQVVTVGDRDSISWREAQRWCLLTQLPMPTPALLLAQLMAAGSYPGG